MDSADFFYRFENALIEETPDYVSWWVSYSAFASTLQRYNLTRSDVECLLIENPSSPHPQRPPTERGKGRGI